jgi:adenosylcobinamide hydrolase
MTGAREGRGALSSLRNEQADAPMTKTTTSIRGITVTIDERAVRVDSDAQLTALSSAMWHGGFGEARHIVNMHVDDVPLDAMPEDELRAFAEGLGVGDDFIGLMTATKTQNARLAEAAHDGLAVAAVVSMGLSNRLCAGVSPPAAAGPGTINTIVLVDAALSPAAFVNAVITATEAKASVLASFDVRTADGLPVSGTSTDAVVVACTGRGAAVEYAGPATTAGWLIARAVRQALEQICREQIERDGGRRIDW